MVQEGDVQLRLDVGKSRALATIQSIFKSNMLIVRKQSFPTSILYIFLVLVAVGTLLVLSACSTVRGADVDQTTVINTSSVATTIAACYREITGRRMENIKSINMDTHNKLEDCVNDRVESEKRIELVYVGSERGLIPSFLMRNVFYEENTVSELDELIQSIKTLKTNPQLSDEEKLARAMDEIDEYVKDDEL